MSITIYYDGECYFCNNYVTKLKLQEQYGEVKLVSLRDNTEARSTIESLGLNVNNGFVVEHEGKFLYGTEAFKFINNATNSPGAINNLITRFEKAPSIIYNSLVILRYAFLIIQGLGLIDLKQQNETGFLTRSIRLSLTLLFLTFSTIYVLNPDTITIISALTFLGLYIWSFIKITIPSYFSKAFAGQTYAFWFSYLIISLVITNLADITAERRIIFFLTFLPLLGWIFDRYRNTSSQKTSSLLLILSSAFVLLPGLYLAPFYGGISGWYVEVNKNTPVRASTYELIRTDGESINLSHALLEPSSMLGRFKRAWRKAGRNNQEYMDFQFQNYERLYPILKEGRFSHQRHLGKLAYPTHTLSDADASQYKYYPPESIKEVVHVSYLINWSGELLERKVIEIYQPPKSN